MGFDRQETAVRVRDLIKKQADRQIGINVPSPLVGRVTVLDVNNLKAMVWFAGDENPIEVNLFSSTIPGTSEAGYPQGNSNGLQGYGSMVVCQRLNGLLYVTHVLSGGQFSFDFGAMNFGLIATNPYIESEGGFQYPIGSTVETKLGVELGTLEPGDRAVFGPFTRENDNGMNNMWVEIDVHTDSGGSATYRFHVDPFNEFYYASHDVREGRWFRILPDGETADGGEAIDWTLDIALRDTAYGTTKYDLNRDEVWFRLTPSFDFSAAAFNVVIRSPYLNKSRSIDGYDKFIVDINTDLTEIKGYLGVHNAKFMLFDFDNYKIRENFERTVAAGGLGNNPDFFNQAYTLSGGSASEYQVTGGAAVITQTSANVSRRFWLNGTDSIKTDHDITFSFSVSAVATGASYHFEVRPRKTASTTFYMMRCELTTAGQINLATLKNVAGAVTSISSVSSVVTYAADQIIHCRARLYGPTLRMKVWQDGTAQSNLWNLVSANDTAITAAGDFEFSSQRATGNTNVNPLFRFYGYENNTDFQNESNDVKWHTGPFRSAYLRYAQDLQRTMMIEGEFIWDGSNLRWTGDIFLGGIGRNSLILPGARHNISMPGSGVLISRFGGEVPGGINTVANGIPLALGDALYCAVPPGENEKNLAHHLFIVAESQLGVEFALPEYAVLIAKRAPTLPQSTDTFGAMPIRLGTGDWLDYWHEVGSGGGNPAFATGWANQGGSFSTVAFRKIDPFRVELKGGADHTTTAAAPNTIFTLPTGYRPSTTRRYLVSNNPATATAPAPRGLHITNAGLVQVTNFAGTIDVGAVTFDGLIFQTNG